MKKLLFAALLTAALTFAQDTGGSTGKTAHKGGKSEKVMKAKKGAKSKKGSGGSTTPPPK
jgi:hypothetical protein